MTFFEALAYILKNSDDRNKRLAFLNACDDDINLLDQALEELEKDAGIDEVKKFILTCDITDLFPEYEPGFECPFCAGTGESYIGSCKICKGDGEIYL